MHLKPFLCCTSLLVLLACPVLAAEPLAPRGEVSVKGGTDRSLLTTEFWAPLAQQSDRVLYGDIRLMGDNDDNREGNLGVGYRQIKNDAVVGVHGWIDRRRTQHNSTFHQLTFGVERLGHIVDARANVYIPINNGRTIITPNMGVTTPYLAGSGIYYDTNGSISETPQYGIDGELGYRLPIFQKQIDAIRVYGGGYYFFRDNTVEVPGARFRTEAQVNKIVSVGARVQYDKPRGTQGFLEATLKFPFSAKRLYQESGIRSRLDESPERDVDIVTESKVTDTGLRKPVIDAVTGTQQRILYVDNTKADGGDGSYEKPFNNLKAAEAALQANDILYINRGDGTTRNMNQGIVIDKPNVQLIGSATPLTYGGVTFLNAGAAPVITNTQASTDEYTGNGLLITNSNFSISGVTITGSTLHGLSAVSNSGQTIDNISIKNTSIVNNKTDGIKLLSRGMISNVTIDNVVTSNNRMGTYLIATNNGALENITTSNLTSSNNTITGFNLLIQNSGTANKINLTQAVLNSNQRGIQVGHASTGVIGNVTLDNVTANSNSSDGMQIASSGNGNNIEKLNINNIVLSNNTGSGINITNSNNSRISQLNITNVMATNNTNGISLNLQSGTVVNAALITNYAGSNNRNSGLRAQTTGGASLQNLSISNANTNNNAATGIDIQNTSGTMGKITIENTTSNSNGATGNGITVRSDSGTQITSVSIKNSIMNSNTYGIQLFANSGVISMADIQSVTANNNKTYGFYFQAASAVSSILNNVSLSSSNAAGNATAGVALNKGTLNGGFNVDLGGGSAGSTGQNRFFGNTGVDLRIDGGYAATAKNVWWGNVAGLQTGRRTLNNGSTVDSSAFLTTDPRP